MDCSCHASCLATDKGGRRVTPPWLRTDAEDCILTLHVQPGAKKTAVAGLHGEALKLRLAALPVDGKANECLLNYLAEQLGIAKTRLELISGATSRAKRVRVLQLSAERIVAKLA